MSKNRLPEDWKATETPQKNGNKSPTSDQLWDAIKESADSLDQNIPGLTDGEELPEELMQMLDDNLGVICSVMNEAMDALSLILQSFSPTTKTQMTAWLTALEARKSLEELAEEVEDDEE